MSRLSNLPSGVSGNEYQISGPHSERDTEMECGTEGVTITTISPFGQERLNKVLDLLREDPSKQARDVYSYLLTAQDEVREVEMETCPFNDTVTVYRHGYDQWWTCPLCTTEHQGVAEDERDEDYGSDR
jgi:hypothetical protein